MREHNDGSAARWQSCAPEDIVWLSWEDDFVAYHRPSGKTHFLNAASNFLIARHLAEPRSTDDVALAFMSAAAAHGDTLPDVVPLLEHLEHLGLIDSL